MTIPGGPRLGGPFEIVRRGYATEQVDEYIERLEYDLRIATANQDATSSRIAELTNEVGKLHGETDALRAELDRTALQPISEQGLSERLRRRIAQANETADEIRANARREAEHLRADVAGEREQWDEAYAALQEQQERASERFNAELDERRAAADQEAAAHIAAAEAEAQRIRSEAQEAATALESATRAEMTEFESRTRREMAELEATTRAAAEELESSTRARLDELEASTRSRIAALDDRARQERDTLQEDFTLGLSAKRGQAHRAIDEAVRVAQANADARVAAATGYAQRVVADALDHARTMIAAAADQSHRRVSDADAAVAALREVRSDLARQVAELIAHLDAVRSAAEAGRKHLDPLPVEDGAPSAGEFPPQPDARPTDPAIDGAGWQPPAPPAELAGMLPRDLPDMPEIGAADPGRPEATATSVPGMPEPDGVDAR